MVIGNENGSRALNAGNCSGRFAYEAGSLDVAGFDHDRGGQSNHGETGQSDETLVDGHLIRIASAVSHPHPQIENSPARRATCDRIYAGCLNLFPSESGGEAAAQIGPHQRRRWAARQFGLVACGRDFTQVHAGPVEPVYFLEQRHGSRKRTV